MRRGAENYAAIFSSTDAAWRDYSFQSRESVRGLSIIGASQLYPIILAALEQFERPEMEKLLRLLETIAVRYQLVIRGRPGRIESLGGRTARDIWDNKIKKTSEVLTALSEHIRRRFQATVCHSFRKERKESPLYSGGA
jgi:hypothetical protein